MEYNSAIPNWFKLSEDWTPCEENKIDWLTEAEEEKPPADVLVCVKKCLCAAAAALNECVALHFAPSVATLVKIYKLKYVSAWIC